MKASEAILKRRSVRKFLDKPVEDDLLRLLLESAMAAPSAVNMQPWEFYIVRNTHTLEKLRASTPYTNMNSPLIIIVAGNSDRFLPEGKADFWVQDCSAATQNILITAVELGLGTCWCGIYPKRDAIKSIRNILELEDHIIPLSLIHIGYPSGEHEARTQFNENYVHHI